MKIVVIGLNHKTAAVGIRERLAFNEERAGEALQQLKGRFSEGEYVLLSTCNRVELYAAVPGESGPTGEELAGFLSEFCAVGREEWAEYFYEHRDEEAVRHLLKVSCSLDSMVVGEPQIIAQVKDSYRLAGRVKSTGKVINRLFHCAFATSKEIYATTSIAQRRVSVAGVAVELARQLFADIKAARVLVIGAGQMGELLIRHLQEVGCCDITVTSRTRERGQETARRYGVGAGRWEQLDEQLAGADIVAAAAGADRYLCDKASFKRVLSRRRGGALLVIDIAVPRNFDPAINDLDDVYLYSVDDLGRMVQENLEARAEDMGAAAEIIEDNVGSFMDWFGVRDIGPLVGKLREKFHEISREELEKFLRGERALEPMVKRQLETMVNRTVNKLLHRLINSLHEVAQEKSSDEAVSFIERILHQQDRAAKRKKDEG